MLITLTLVFLSLVAVICIALGLRGRRVGDNPYCRKCNYNVVHSCGDCCSECGVQLSPTTVAIGRRERRRLLIVAGSLLAVLAGIGLFVRAYAAAMGLNWYSYYPNFLIIQYAVDDDIPAIKELTSRFEQGDIAGDRLVDVVPIALERQGDDLMLASSRAWADLLACIHESGFLSKEQELKFLGQIIKMNTSMRSSIRSSDPLRLDISYTIWGSPHLQGQFRLRLETVQVVPRNQSTTRSDSPQSNNKARITLPLSTLTRQLGHISPILYSGYLSSRSSFYEYSAIPVELSPGQYTLRIGVAKEFLYLGNSDWQHPSLVREHVIALGFEILPKDAEPPVRMVKKPTFRDAFKAAISVSCDRRDKRGRLRFCVHVANSVSMDACFELIAREANRDTSLGFFPARACERTALTVSLPGKLEIDDGASFVPILRSSVDCAMSYTDMTEIWDGEIKLDPVVVGGVG